MRPGRTRCNAGCMTSLPKPTLAKDGVANPNSPRGVLPGAADTTGGWRGNTFVPGKDDPYGVPYGGGRADVRLSLGGDGEIYIMSKSDGMIRKMMAVVTPPPAPQQMASH